MNQMQIDNILRRNGIEDDNLAKALAELSNAILREVPSSNKVSEDILDEYRKNKRGSLS